MSLKNGLVVYVPMQDTYSLNTQTQSTYDDYLPKET